MSSCCQKKTFQGLGMGCFVPDSTPTVFLFFVIGCSTSVDVTLKANVNTGQVARISDLRSAVPSIASAFSTCVSSCEVNYNAGQVKRTLKRKAELTFTVS